MCDFGQKNQLRVHILNSHLLKDYIDLMKIRSQDCLPCNFNKYYIHAVSKSSSPLQLYRLLLSEMKTSKTITQFVKLLTISHWYLIETGYDLAYIDIFESEVDENTGGELLEVWLLDFVRNYFLYLRKLYSIADIYRRAKTAELNPSLDLNEIFRIINQLTLLFPSAVNVFNTVGRYKYELVDTFEQLFAVLQGEVVCVYAYLQRIFLRCIYNYSSFNWCEMTCLVDIAKEYELLSDKIEQLVLSKYFSAMILVEKIAIDEEFIERINYYLKYSKIAGSARQFNSPHRTPKSKLSPSNWVFSNRKFSKSSACDTAESLENK